jgi:hypothetical protein
MLIVIIHLLLSMILFGLLLILQGLLNSHIGINDESNDQVDEDQHGQLHESNEEEKDDAILFLVIEQLEHVDVLFPVILPHHAKQGIESHVEIVEVQVHPLSVDHAIGVIRDLLD